MVLLLGASSGCLFHHHKQVNAGLLDDKVTADRVEAALKDSPDLKQVRVEANGGEVTLSGTVKNAGAKERAAQLARRVHRVHKLNNDIQVRP